MSQMPPTISVCMAVHNCSPYLQQSIESILNQTFTDFEFLIIDDGSTDNSLAILQQYALRDERIRLTSHENRGISKTRNEMLSQARGEFIAVMDADDVAKPQRFAYQVDFLRQHPDVVCVGGAIEWIDGQGNFLANYVMPQEDAELQQLLVGGISLLHHPCVMARRPVLIQAGGYDETMVASVDLDLWLRVGELGKLANLQEVVLAYRLHSQSITQAKQQQQEQDALAACQRAWKRRGIESSFIRQPADHLRQYDFWLHNGWKNLMERELEGARRCGQRAIALKPWKRPGWQLLLAALKPFALGRKL